MKKIHQDKMQKLNKQFLGVKNHKLTFIECSKRDTNKREYIFKCLCDCGKIREVRKRHFTLTGTKSCGCIKKGRPKLNPGEVALNQFYNSYKMSAKRRNINFKLTKKQVETLSLKNCYYCGIPPEIRFSRQFNDLHGSRIFNGIDRKNNKLGYTIDNSVPCCKICNRAKNNLDELDFKEWIKRINIFNKN